MIRASLLLALISMVFCASYINYPSSFGGCSGGNTGFNFPLDTCVNFLQRFYKASCANQKMTLVQFNDTDCKAQFKSTEYNENACQNNVRVTCTDFAWPSNYTSIPVFRDMQCKDTQPVRKYGPGSCAPLFSSYTNVKCIENNAKFQQYTCTGSTCAESSCKLTGTYPSCQEGELVCGMAPAGMNMLSLGIALLLVLFLWL